MTQLLPSSAGAAHTPPSSLLDPVALTVQNPRLHSPTRWQLDQALAGPESAPWEPGALCSLQWGAPPSCREQQWAAAPPPWEGGDWLPNEPSPQGSLGAPAWTPGESLLRGVCGTGRDMAKRRCCTLPSLGGWPLGPHDSWEDTWLPCPCLLAEAPAPADASTSHNLCT